MQVVQLSGGSAFATFFCQINSNGNISKFTIDDGDYTPLLTNISTSYNRKCFLPNFMEKKGEDEFVGRYRDNAFIKEAMKVIKDKDLVDPRIKDKDKGIKNIIHTIFFHYQQEDLFGKLSSYAQRKLKKIETQKQKDIYCRLILCVFPIIIENVQRYLLNFSCNISYAKPLRANVERYYRPRLLSTYTVASDGSNLVEYLNDLSPSKKEEFDKWMIENFNFTIIINSDGGHQSILIKNQSDCHNYNITAT